MEKLSPNYRLPLMKFVCSFAWADLQIRDSERKFVAKMVKMLGLGAEETAQVQAWLKVPPRAEEVDLTTIPPMQRMLFLNTIRDVINSDGEVTHDEWEKLSLFEQLLC